MEIASLESFEQEFEAEEFETLVLVKNECNGAAVYEKEYLCPSVDIYASVDCRTMELSKYSSDMEAFDMSMRKFASEIMLDDANDWLESDDSEDKPEEITEQMFVEKMTINELVLCSDGSVTAYYDDGDLFWGHSIIVEIDENGEFSDAYIAG